MDIPGPYSSSGNCQFVSFSEAKIAHKYFLLCVFFKMHGYREVSLSGICAKYFGGCSLKSPLEKLLQQIKLI